MLFNSGAFWSFLAAACCAYYLTPRRFRWVPLLAASYYFYASFRPSILAVLVFLTGFVYLVTRVMQSAHSRTTRRLLLVADVGVPLLALVVFKYVGLIAELLEYLGSPFTRASVGPINVLAPIGISFYTFKLLSYAIDVYHHRIAAERHPGYFALYVSFFPQILAGPIERPGHLLPQLRQSAAFDLSAIWAGVKLAAWGLFKKMVVADRLAYYVGEVFVSPEYKGFHLVLGAWFYYFQIYADFSGYSDISIGISRALGFSPPANFDYPYLSRSVSQFWTRWHITLSTWLRDYLFVPITYAVMRRIDGDTWLGIRTETWGYVVGMSATMLLGGLWHGAAFTFAAWGALHGAFLVCSYVTKKARRLWCRAIGLSRVPRLHHAVSLVVTFQFVTLAWILFRATSFENAWTYVRYMQIRLPAAGRVNLLFGALVVLVLLAAEYVQRHADEVWVVRRVPVEVKAVGYALFAVMLIVFSVDTNNPFIYFRF